MFIITCLLPLSGKLLKEKGIFKKLLFYNYLEQCLAPIRHTIIERTHFF